MLFMTNTKIFTQCGYDDIAEVMIRLQWGYINPLNGKSSTGYWINLQFVRTLL